MITEQQYIAKVVLATANGKHALAETPHEQNVKRVHLTKLVQQRTPAPITIVEMNQSCTSRTMSKLIKHLADHQSKSTFKNFIILTTGVSQTPISPDIFRKFARPELVQIEENPKCVWPLVKHLAMKWEILNEGYAGPRASPLDRVPAIARVNDDLREDNGRLSVKKTAALYGLSLSDFARWLGCTRQALSKTPAAASLQDALAYFDRIARMRRVISGDAAFRKWMRTPNAALAQKPPLYFLQSKRWQALADFVDDILTGTPG